MKANKVLAAASAAMMAMGMLTVPAFAVSSITASKETCGVCGTVFSTYEAVGLVTYEEYFSVSSVPEITNDYLLHRYSSEITPNVCAYNGTPICLSCLEKKVNEYKAGEGSTVPDADGTHTGSTNVTAEVPGDYTITVPETVALTGDTGSGEKTATVKVTLKGDVAEDQTVTVTVNDPVMKRSGAQDVPVAVTAPKISWNRDELLNDGTSSDYVVKASLTPGDWTGIMTFECTLA